MRKRMCAVIVIIILLVLVCTCCICTLNNRDIKWRTDTAPIVKRIPLFSNCKNILWHGEVITKNSFLTVPGPSAYRIVCFVPQASRVVDALFVAESVSNPEAVCADLSNVERGMLKSRYGVDVNCNPPIVNGMLTETLIRSPYWGQCLYFKGKDVLCTILFGE